MTTKIYFDSAATAKPHQEILEKMKPFFQDNFGNPSGFHQFSHRAKKALNLAREKVANILGAQFEEIIFTSGGTESNNLAIFGAILANDKNIKQEILTTSVEHPSVLQPLQNLPKNFTLKILPVDSNGFLSPEIFLNSITEKTLFSSVIFTNNEIGTINPIEKLATIAKEKKIIFHTDACQTPGIFKINLQKLPIDLLSLNGAKIGGPRGTGILFKKKNIKLKPLFFGGNQEFGLRSGTENVAGAVGFAEALEISQQNLINKQKKFQNFQKKIVDFITAKIPAARLNGPLVGDNRSFLNLNFSFLNCEGESLVLALDHLGFATATGSACASEKLQISHVLSALGLPHEIAHGSLRISFSPQTTNEEIEKFLPVLKDTVEKIRKISSTNFSTKDFPACF